MPCQLLLARNLTRPPAFYRLMLYQFREALLEALGIVTVDKAFSDGIGVKLFAKYGRRHIAHRTSSIGIYRIGPLHRRQGAPVQDELDGCDRKQF